MTQIKNNINTYADLTAYNADLNKEYPNISYIQASDGVLWNKYDPDHIVCKYNVTSTSEATTLLFSNSGITYQIIDGVRQDTVQMNYTFDTPGEHIVKYKLSTNNINFSFNGCTTLTSMIMPNNILQIGHTYFCNECTSLTSVKLSDNLNYINDASFYGCSSLTDITIPSGVTYIGGGYNKGTFQNCISLTSVTVKATTPPGLLSYSFNNTNNCPIYVPAESVNAYKAASGWSTYASRIQAIPSV